MYAETISAESSIHAGCRPISIGFKIRRRKVCQFESGRGHHGCRACEQSLTSALCRDRFRNGGPAMKVHLHSEQFDGAPHPWCGRGKAAAPSSVFEATLPTLRCSLCARDWFPRGQPHWHLLEAQRANRARQVAELVADAALVADAGSLIRGIK